MLQSRTGPQEALPATRPLEGRGCSCRQCDQCQPVPCCLPSPEGKIVGNMSSFLLPDERLQRCTRELRGVMDRGPVEVNHGPAWRARRRAQRTDHAKATMLLPHRGELKILFSPGSQINKVLRVFQISKKKKKSHYQLSNQIDWWVVLSTGSLYLASDAKTGVKARSLY